EASELLVTLVRDVAEMTTKEERVLYPTSARLLTLKDWKEIREGEDEIGWMIPVPPASWQAKGEMGSYLNSSPERLEAILSIIKEFFDGKSLDEMEERFKLELKATISPGEFALAEQKMEDIGVSDAEFEAKVTDLLKLFKKSLEKANIKDLPAGHPLDTFIKENTAIRELVSSLEKTQKEVDLKNVDHAFWKAAYDKIWQIDVHYVRKENQLFPFLEIKGFDKPSTVMWAMHDDVRGLIKAQRAQLDAKKYEEFFLSQDKMFRAIEDMIFKEEKILWAASLELISEKEWAEIRGGEDEVGYCLIPAPPMWNPGWKHPSEPGSNGDTVKDATNLVNVDPVPFEAPTKAKAPIGGINLEVGSVTPEQINLIFKHLPFDVTYVDENDEVRYYNKGEDRVFPRSPGIIGRQVKYCHPPKSVHIVEKIVDAFKSGERSEANFWINFRDKFVYIQYFAVRDDDGNYKGVLEITYDAATVRSLEGEQRLLDWE
ncbi:PAS domain-containing protein, partial [Myxococcota bacterium]|nr:PAS domain-containing protein [Myxococcota bacterium]